MSSEESELECRVCRSGPEQGRPLHYPCMCSGSIGAVHQDCLEAWLNHSKKDTCELCSTKYKFEAQYADDAPKVVPTHVFVWSLLKMFFVQILPFLLRIVLAIVIWVVVVPTVSSSIYCLFVGRQKMILDEVDWWEKLRMHIIHGFNIDAIIALSLLIMV
jgi:E3 ubiquitin-protein ligase DOA10